MLIDSVTVVKAPVPIRARTLRVILRQTHVIAFNDQTRVVNRLIEDTRKFTSWTLSAGIGKLCFIRIMFRKNLP